jgi:hypothetical protein
LSSIIDKVASWSDVQVRGEASIINRVLSVAPAVTSLKTFAFGRNEYPNFAFSELPISQSATPLHSITELEMSYMGLGELPHDQSNSVKSLTLSHVETFVPELLSLFPALQHLKQKDVGLGMPSWEDMSVETTIAKPSTAVALRYLTSFRVDCHSDSETINEDFLYFMTIIEMASNSLEKLELQFSLDANFRLPILPRLQMLELTLFTDDSDEEALYELEQSKASDILSNCPALRTISVTWDKYHNEL